MEIEKILKLDKSDEFKALTILSGLYLVVNKDAPDGDIELKPFQYNFIGILSDIDIMNDEYEIIVIKDRDILCGHITRKSIDDVKLVPAKEYQYKRFTDIIIQKS